MFIYEAFELWSQEIRPMINENDRVALAESWNDYTDSLCRGRDISDMQYHYCPAFDDDDMPTDEESEIEYMLSAIGLTFDCVQVSTGHFKVTIRRGISAIETRYSQGSAIKTNPELHDVLASLLMDAGTLYEGQTFEDWAAELGYNEDSRKAERIYESCRKIEAHLNEMFSSSEMDDLRELLEDY